MALWLRSGGCGFEPWPGHTKDLKIVPTAFLPGARQFKNDERELNTRSYQWTIGDLS